MEPDHQIPQGRLEIGPRMRLIIRLIIMAPVLLLGVDVAAQEGLAEQGAMGLVHVEGGGPIGTNVEQLMDQGAPIFPRPTPLILRVDAQPLEHFGVPLLIPLILHRPNLLPGGVAEVLETPWMIGEPLIRPLDHLPGEMLRGLLAPHDLVKDHEAVLGVHLREDAHGAVPAEVPAPIDNPPGVEDEGRGVERDGELGADSRALPGEAANLDLAGEVIRIGPKVSLSGQPLLRFFGDEWVITKRIFVWIGRVVKSDRPDTKRICLCANPFHALCRNWYSRAVCKSLGSSLKHPRPRLQFEHRSCRTLPVLWS